MIGAAGGIRTREALQLTAASRMGLSTSLPRHYPFYTQTVAVFRGFCSSVQILFWRYFLTYFESKYSIYIKNQYIRHILISFIVYLSNTNTLTLESGFYCSTYQHFLRRYDQQKKTLFTKHWSFFRFTQINQTNISGTNIRSSRPLAPQPALSPTYKHNKKTSTYSGIICMRAP